MNIYSAPFRPGKDAQGTQHSLHPLRNAKIALHRHHPPVPIPIVIGSVLRNMNNKKVSQANIIHLAERNTIEPGNQGIPFAVKL